MENEPSLGEILGAALKRKEKTMTIAIDTKAVATMIEAAGRTGRTDRDILDMLTDGERREVLNGFCKLQSIPKVVSVAPFKATIWLDHSQVSRIDRKIDAIKRVRDVIGSDKCGLKEVKDFVEGTSHLHVTSYQTLRELRNYFSDMFRVTLFHS